MHSYCMGVLALCCTVSPFTPKHVAVKESVEGVEELVGIDCEPPFALAITRPSSEAMIWQGRWSDVPLDCHATPMGCPRLTGFGRAAIETVGAGGGGGFCVLLLAEFPPPKRFENIEPSELPIPIPPMPLMTPEEPDKFLLSP